MIPAKPEPRIYADIQFPDRADMTFTVPNGTAVHIADYLARMLGTLVPDCDIRMDLDPRSFMLKGTGCIELPDRRRVGTIRLRRASDQHLRAAS